MSYLIVSTFVILEYLHVHYYQKEYKNRNFLFVPRKSQILCYRQVTSHLTASINFMFFQV